MILNQLLQFKNILSDQILASWKDLEESTINNNNKMMVCFCGQQGVGQSSLCNLFLENPIIPDECDDTITIPIHIEYGSVLNARHVSDSGSASTIEVGDFANSLHATATTDGYICIQTSLDLLQGVTLIYLPGEIGHFPRYEEKSDAIIYMIPPEGLSTRDTENIRSLSDSGKQILISVCQRDGDKSGQKMSASTVDIITSDLVISKDIIIK